MTTTTTAHKRCIHHNTEWRWFRKPAGVPFSGRSGGRSVSLFSFLFSVIYWVGIGENCWCVERLIIEKRSSGISLPFSQSRERETLLVGRNVWLRAIHHQRRRARHHPANPARMRKAYFQIKSVCVYGKLTSAIIIGYIYLCAGWRRKINARARASTLANEPDGRTATNIQFSFFSWWGIYSNKPKKVENINIYVHKERESGSLFIFRFL